TDLNATTQQVFAPGLNVRHGQVQTLGGARRCRGDVLAEDDRASRTGRRELDYAPLVAGSEIGVESPPELRVELLRTIDIGDGDDDHLKLRIDSRDVWFLASIFFSRWLNLVMVVLLSERISAGQPDKKNANAFDTFARFLGSLWGRVSRR